MLNQCPNPHNCWHVFRKVSLEKDFLWFSAHNFVLVYLATSVKLEPSPLSIWPLKLSIQTQAEMFVFASLGCPSKPCPPGQGLTFHQQLGARRQQRQNPGPWRISTQAGKSSWGSFPWTLSIKTWRTRKVSKRWLCAAPSPESCCRLGVLGAAPTTLTQWN